MLPQGLTEDGGRRARVILGALALLFVALCVPSLNRPIEKWENQNFSAAERLATTGGLGDAEQIGAILIHPPVWCYTMAAAFRLFGVGDAQAKIPGLLVVLATGLVLFSLAKLALGDERKALIAAGLYLLHPLVIQGGLSDDFTDGTLLPLALLSFFVCWFRSSSWPEAKRTALLAAVFAVCLWTKLTTPLGLIPCLWLFSLVKDRGVRWNPIQSASLIAIAGGAAFALTWSAYCRALSASSGVPMSELLLRPLKFITNSGGGTFSVTGVPWRDYAVLWARALLWFGPLLFSTAAWAMLRRVKQLAGGAETVGRDILLIFALIVMAAYTVMQGGAGAFPKYFIALVPFLALYAADAIDFNAGLAEISLLFAGGLAYYFFIAGDPLYVLNYGLRGCALNSDCRAQALRLALKLALYALPVVGLGAFSAARSEKHFFSSRILVLIFSAQTAMSLLQATSPYFVRYFYGASISDFRSAVEKISGLPEPRTALAPGTFLFLARAHSVRCENARGNVWEHPDAIERCVADGAPQSFVYGLPENTIGQVMSISRDKTLDAILARRYRKQAVGDWTVWTRDD